MGCERLIEPALAFLYPVDEGNEPRAYRAIDGKFQAEEFLSSLRRQEQIVAHEIPQDGGHDRGS